MTVVLLRRGAARDATEFEDAHLVVVVAFLRLVGLVLFIFEDEDEAHAFAKDETAVAAQNMVFLRRSHSLSLEEQLFVRAHRFLSPLPTLFCIVCCDQRESPQLDHAPPPPRAARAAPHIPLLLAPGGTAAAGLEAGTLDASSFLVSSTLLGRAPRAALRI